MAVGEVEDLVAAFGDVGVVGGDDDDATAAGDGEDESPASTPAEASQRMLQRRNVRPAFSRHINYDKLQAIYRMGDGDSRESSEPASTRAGSVFGDERPQSAAAVDDEEDEEVASDAEAGTDEDGFQEEYDDAMEVARSEDEVDLDEVGMRDPDEY